MAHLQLAQQAERQQLHSGHDQHGSEDQQRTVLVHDIYVTEELAHDQKHGNETSHENAKSADRTEKVQRTRKITKQKTNRDQVKKDAEGAPDAVVRNTALTVYILDRNFTDGRAMPRGQRGNKAMHLAIERHQVDELAAVGLVSRA